MQRLPDAEFEIMKTVWQFDGPVTAATIKNQLDEKKDWKVQTVIALLNRLIKKGFLRTEKKAERTYAPLVSQQEYLKCETEHFLEQYHGGSFLSLFSTLQGNKLSEKAKEELSHLLEELREKL
jgi:BlaI family penicillinase repressor